MTARRTHGSARAWLAAWVCFVGSLAAARVSHAQEITEDACIEAHAGAQKELRNGALIAGKALLIACSSEACPPLVKTDCIEMLAGVEKSTPTIVIDARDPSGADTLAARLFVDGKLLFDALDGQPIALDPGKHELRLERDGSEPIVQSLVVQEGVKRRLIPAHFEPLALCVSAPAQSQALVDEGDDAGSQTLLESCVASACSQELRDACAKALETLQTRQQQTQAKPRVTPSGTPDNESDPDVGRMLSAALAITAGIATAVALGTGIAFGVSALDTGAELDAICPNDICPDSLPTRDTHRSGLSAAETSNVAFALTGVFGTATIVGLILWAVSGDEAADANPAQAVTVGPLLSPTMVGAWGRF